MQYLLLLYVDQNTFAAMSEAEQKKGFAAYMEFNKVLLDKGALVTAAQLKSTETATTIRGDAGGKLAMTDGPFAEAKEQLGGFYLLECASLDDALALAKQCPGAWHGAVEVRPVAFNPMQQRA